MAVAFRLPTLAPRERGQVRTPLTVVPQTERRYVKTALVAFSVFVVLFFVATLQMHMAQQQMRLDKLNYDISRARQHFDQLRAERASLQSPEHLMEASRQMGLMPGRTTTIVNIPASIAAEVAATVGKVDADVVSETESPLDEFGRLKASVVGTP
jgi:cell division protein FtsL